MQLEQRSCKGSLTAEAVADCMEAGFRRVYGRRLSLVKIPLSTALQPCSPEVQVL